MTAASTKASWSPPRPRRPPPHPPTTTTTPPMAPRRPTGSAGLDGPDVLALEQRLDSLSSTQARSTASMTVDRSRSHGVPEAHGLERTARATTGSHRCAERRRARQAPLLPGGGANRVEVDLPRQILMLCKDGELYKVVDVSTGSGKRYCVDGECATAVTPGGSYKIVLPAQRLAHQPARQALQPAVLQRRHRHPRRAVGARRIPRRTVACASRCTSSTWFPDVVPNGTPVYVIGGSRAARAVQRARRPTPQHHHDGRPHHVDDLHVDVDLDGDHPPPPPRPARAGSTRRRSITPQASGSAKGSSIGRTGTVGAASCWVLFAVTGVAGAPRVVRQLGSAGRDDAAAR